VIQDLETFLKYHVSILRRDYTEAFFNYQQSVSDRCLPSFQLPESIKPTCTRSVIENCDYRVCEGKRRRHAQAMVSAFALVLALWQRVAIVIRVGKSVTL
jgi:hypothetical protein